MCLADLERVRNLIGQLLDVESALATLRLPQEGESTNDGEASPLRRITDEEYEEVLMRRKASMEASLEALGFNNREKVA